MRHSEEVTFGGSGLDRAAELRGDAQALTMAAADAGARWVVLWRGKPLVTGQDRLELMRLPAGHPLLAEGPQAGHVLLGHVLLGREAGGPVFVQDISGWTPADLDAAGLKEFLDTSEQQHPACPEGRFADLRHIMTRLTPRDAELAATAKGLLGWHATHGFCARCGNASDMVDAGWQRRCPSCGASHFPRTDPVVIMLITRGNRTLLGRSPGWPEGMYSCLAGFVEPGETLEAAVRREVFEEAGVRVGRVSYLASQPWVFPSSLMMGMWGEALSEDITLDPLELEDAVWVTREDLADAAAGLRPGMMPARKGAIAHFLLRNWLADRLD